MTPDAYGGGRARVCAWGDVGCPAGQISVSALEANLGGEVSRAKRGAARALSARGR